VTKKERSSLKQNSIGYDIVGKVLSADIYTI